MRTVPFIVLMLLMTPAAAAAAPIDGAVMLHDEPTFEGRLDLQSRDAGIDLGALADRNEPPRLSWSSAEGTIFTSEWYETPQDAAELGGEAGRESIWLESGRVALLECAPGCMILLYSEGEGIVRAQLDQQGALAWSPVPERYWAQVAKEGANTFLHDFPGGSLRIGGADAGSVGEARAEGRMLLFARDAVLVFAEHEPGREEMVDLRQERKPLIGAAPLALAQVYTRHLVLTLEAAEFEASLDDVVVFAPSALAQLSGSFASTDASGRVVSSRGTHDFTHAGLELRGDLTFEFAAVESYDLLGDRHAAPHLTFSGDVDEAWVAGVRTASPLDDASAPATITLLLAAALVALRLLALPLYSRIAPGRVLDNDKRRDILAMLVEHPGSTAAEIGRALDIKRAVLRHHLMLLAAHGFLSSRSQGRRRLYFAAGEPMDAGVLDAKVTLRDLTRRRLAEALLEGDLTQSSLAGRTGLSRRLVSYHLGRLEAARLVEVDGRWRRAYHPTTLLREVLEDASETDRSEKT